MVLKASEKRIDINKEADIYICMTTHYTNKVTNTHNIYYQKIISWNFMI